MMEGHIIADVRVFQHLWRFQTVSLHPQNQQYYQIIRAYFLLDEVYCCLCYYEYEYELRHFFFHRLKRFINSYSLLSLYIIPTFEELRIVLIFLVRTLSLSIFYYPFIKPIEEGTSGFTMSSDSNYHP
jgi:hypothetical protein